HAYFSRLFPFPAALRRRLIRGFGLRRGASGWLRASSLLTAGLATLAGRLWIEVAFVLVKCVRTVVDTRLRRPSLRPPRCVLRVTRIIVASGCRPVWCRRIRGAVVA